MSAGHVQTVESAAVSRGVSILLGVGFAVLAVATALASALVARMIWRPGPISVPYGLVLALAATSSLVLAARTISKRLAIVTAIAWMVGLGYVVKGTGGGSFLIADDVLGWAFIMLGTAAALLPAAWGSGARR